MLWKAWMPLIKLKNNLENTKKGTLVNILFKSQSSIFTLVMMLVDFKVYEDY